MEDKLIFHNLENRQDLQQAIDIANKIKEKVFFEIRQRKQFFLCSNASPQIIANLMESFEKTMDVRTYVTRNRRVLGYFTKSKPTTIHLNKASFPRKTESIVATLWHEFTHAVDFFSEEYFFHHDGNKFRSWKTETAPYWIGNIAGKIASYELGENKNLLENKDFIFEQSHWCETDDLNCNTSL